MQVKYKNKNYNVYFCLSKNKKEYKVIELENYEVNKELVEREKSHYLTLILDKDNNILLILRGTINQNKLMFLDNETLVVENLVDGISIYIKIENEFKLSIKYNKIKENEIVFDDITQKLESQNYVRKNRKEEKK